MTDARITGGEGAALAARLLRKLGETELRREFYRALNRATKPLREDAKSNAGRVLPQRGGLARRVSQARLSTRVSQRGFNPGVKIAATGMSQLSKIDDGAVRHPVYGRNVWVEQKITPGWFSEPMIEGAPEVVRELDAAIDRAATEVGRRIQRGQYL